MSQARRKGRAPVASVSALAANVTRTAATAAEVLGHFKATLEQSGMTVAVDAYRKMADTLINQRLWARNHELELGEEHFRRIASEAREIHEVLAAYTQLMGKLMLLPQFAEAAPGPKSGPDPQGSDPAERLIAWLQQRRRPASTTQLRAALGFSTVALNAALEQLEQAGRIVKSRSGGRELYSLSTGV